MLHFTLKTICITLVVWCCGGCSDANNTNSGIHIESYSKKTWKSVISPHESSINVIAINGIEYKGARGAKPFYVNVPKLNAIIFVTNEKDLTATYHIVNRNTGYHILINTPSSVFGDSLNRSPSHDSIEVAKDGTVILSSRYTDYQTDCVTCVYLDLSKKQVANEKSFFYDKNGKLLRVYDPNEPNTPTIAPTVPTK